MASSASFRAVYKKLDGQEIDAKIFVPHQVQQGARCPVVINIHGGAFMLGSSHIVNRAQVEDCLQRGWIVVVPNHRLCPQVNLLEGPMQDCRDLLAWIYDGGLDKEIAHSAGAACRVDTDHVFAFGTSSGGHLALSLGYDVPRPVAGVYDMYGAVNFADPAWTKEIPHIKALLPADLSPDFINQIYSQKPVPIEDGVSLEGQAPGPPDFSNTRQAFVFTQIANGGVPEVIFPSKDWSKVDPFLRVTAQFPPTFIVHGQADTMIPIDISRGFYNKLKEHGVKCGMREIPGEEHTFAAKMQVGSQTWELQREGFDFLESLLEKK